MAQAVPPRTKKRGRPPHGLAPNEAPSRSAFLPAPPPRGKSPENQKAPRALLEGPCWSSALGECFSRCLTSRVRPGPFATCDNNSRRRRASRRDDPFRSRPQGRAAQGGSQREVPRGGGGRRLGLPHVEEVDGGGPGPPLVR